MSILIVALAVLGGMVYILYTVIAYYTQSSSLKVLCEEMKAGTARRRERLDEYEARVAWLHRELPGCRYLVVVRDRWVEMLQLQKDVLERPVAEEKDLKSRKEAIQERFDRARAKKLGR